MVSRQRRIDRAVWLMRRDVEEGGREFRQARMRNGQTLEDVGAVVGVSAATILRNEQGRRPGPNPELMARHAAAVGMRPRIRLYPDGEPLYDAGQLSVIRMLHARVGDPGDWGFEEPLGPPGDQRAIDAVLRLVTARCGFECYARFHDCQAQLRSARLKQRDAELDRMFIVVRGTNANRAALAAAAEILAADFPLGTRQVLAALRAGRDPGANGLIVL
ncbi:MAG: helix-turn-helix domain-containing protein [Candidatus Limnocylindria bacterium]